MKLTIVHNNNKNQLLVSYKTMEQLLERIVKDDARNTVARFRAMVPFLDDSRQYNGMSTWRHIMPAACFEKDENGNLRMKSCNGVLLLLFSAGAGSDGVDRVKRAVAVMPSTLAAMKGADGKSVVVLVSYAATEGSLPDEEADAETLYRSAHAQARMVYQAVVKEPLLSGKPSLSDSFLLTVDARPYYNPQSSPMRVDKDLPSDDLPCEESVETERMPADNDEQQPSVRDTISSMMELLTDRYEFRYNTVMKYVEYLRKDKPWYGFQPVDPRVQKRMVLEVQLADLRVSIRDVRNFLESDYVRNYSPIDDYLIACYGKWDGKDHIRALARTVPNANPHWADWFYTWFLGMVDQWRGGDCRQYGNSVAPLLISRQGYNKSTFCRRLLPPELQWGYHDNLVLSEKRQVYQAMAQFLLINLDEFNQISPQVQQGFLKNLVQLPTVKIKRPYGSHVEEFPRLASFIATSNLTDILTDPSGNRRFIGVELTGPIDVNVRPNYQQLYAQALTALQAREKCYFDAEQVKLIMRNNCQFQVKLPVEQFFHLYFQIPDGNLDARWMTAAEIFSVIKSKVGASLKLEKMIAFGRFLTNLEGLRHKKSNVGMKYWVKMR